MADDFSGKESNLAKALANNIKKVTALCNDIRLRIVLAIFSTESLNIGHSLTLSQLVKLIKKEKQDLSYHLLVLAEAGIIKKENIKEEGKEKTYYQTTEEGIEALKLLDITPDKISQLVTELNLEISV